MTITINNGNGTTAKATTNQSRTKVKEMTATFAGFDIESIDYTQSLEAIQLELAVRKLREAGYHETEISVLTRKGRKAEPTKLLKGHFTGIIRQVNLGQRVFTPEVLNAFESGELAFHGRVHLAHRKAMPNVPVIRKVEDALKHAKEGKYLLVGSEAQLSKLLVGLDDADREYVLENATTTERITRDTILAANIDAKSLVTFFEKAKLDNSVVRVTYGYTEVAFDFAAGAINGKKLLPHVMCLGLPLNPQQTIAFFALTLSGVNRQASAEAKVNAAAPSLFEEEDYGYHQRHDDSRHMAVISNKVGVLSITMKNATAFDISDARSPEEVVAAGRYYLKRGIPVCFEQQAGWLTIGDGALASLVGITVNDEGELIARFGTDATKLTKLLSRPKLATGSIARTIDPDTGESTIVPSGLRVIVGNGRKVRAYGTAVKVWISDFVMGPGSGVAITSPEFTKTVVVEKSVRAEINGVWLGEIQSSKPDANHVELLTEAIKGGLVINRETLRYGDAVISFNGIPYGVWKGRGMEAKVLSEKPKIRVKATSDSIAVTVKVAASYEDFAHKYRADGVKATGLRMRAVCFDVASGTLIEQPDMILSCEEIKGADVALLRAWADSTPDGVDYDPVNGLTDEQKAAFIAWRDAHAKVVEIAIPEMDEFHYNLIKAMVDRASNDPAYAKEMGLDPSMFTFEDGVVTQRCRVVEATMVLGIEVSTVRENIVSQPMIGEQLVALKHLDPQLGNGLWSKAARQRRDVNAMLDMATNKLAGEDVMVTGAILTHDNTLRGRDLLAYYEKLYPNGVIFKCGNSWLPVHFGALGSLGALLPGGSATGVALAVLELLNHLHSSKDSNLSNWANHLNRLIAKVRSTVLKWASSNGIKGRVTRSTKVLAGRKVKTTFSNWLADNEVGLHPDDPAVTSGKVDNGDLVLVSRSPMISVFSGRVVITKDAPLGTILVKAHLWSFGNEGDGDGDPAAFLVVKNADMANRIEAALVDSPFGIKGYEVAHGTDLTELPYAEFFSGNGKEEKNPHTAVHFVKEFTVADYIATADNVGRHYSRFLGRTFAITSYLTYLLGKKLETKGYVDADHETAVVLSWRVLYEGLGLSGYTDKAGKFAKNIASLGNANRVYITAAVAAILANQDYDVKTIGEGEETRFYIEGVEAMKYTWKEATGSTLSDRVAEYFYNAVLTTAAYSLLERELSEFVGPHEVLAEAGAHLVDYLEPAVVYGSLRRGSKGLAVSAALGEEDNNGLFRYLSDEFLSHAGNGIVGQMLTEIKTVQVKASVVRELVEGIDSI